MRRVRLSPVRRFLLAWFDPQRAVPYVSASIGIDMKAALDYLAALERGGVKVTVQALLMACLGRLYAEFPQANRRIIGRRLYQPPEVGVAAPVNLLGHAGEQRMELSVLLIEAVDRKSLVEVAERLSGVKAQERAGQPANPLVRLIVGLADWLPDWAMERGLGLIHAVNRREALATLSWFTLPTTVGLSNPGAVFSKQAGVWVRGAAVALPTWPVHVGSLVGVSAIQDEVVPVDGRPEVRPVLPLVYIFDHRLIDGVMAGRVLTRLAELLQDPAAVFGADGTRRP